VQTSAVREKTGCVVQIDSNTSKGCRVIFHADLGSHNQSALKATLDITFQIKLHFQEVRSLKQFTVEDGVALGELMSVRVAAERHVRRGETFAKLRVNEMFRHHAALKEARGKYPFLEDMMETLVLNELRPPHYIPSKLCNLSPKGGALIGHGLSAPLTTALTSDSGVDEWIVQYPALKELDKELIWFRPMVEVLAKHLLMNSLWGLKMRVFTGAALSMMDMVSDLSMIVTYLGHDEMAVYGWFLLSFVLLCTFLQLCLVYVQNNKKPKVMAYEMLIVVSSLKSVVEAHRVTSGTEKQEHQAFDARLELVLTKVIEIFSESIPGCILQVFVMMKTMKEMSMGQKRAAVVSIFISVAATGFISGTISYDYDGKATTHTPRTRHTHTPPAQNLGGGANKGGCV